MFGTSLLRLLGAALLLGACGGKVVVDGAQGVGGAGGADPSGSTSTGEPWVGCDGKACGDPCQPCEGCDALGSCTTDGTCTLGDVACPNPDPCAGQGCGAECTVCNDVECLQGVCDMDGVCQPPIVVCF